MHLRHLAFDILHGTSGETTPRLGRENEPDECSGTTTQDGFHPPRVPPGLGLNEGNFEVCELPTQPSRLRPLKAAVL